jgi:hypothetical protein
MVLGPFNPPGSRCLCRDCHRRKAVGIGLLFYPLDRVTAQYALRRPVEGQSWTRPIVAIARADNWWHVLHYLSLSPRDHILGYEYVLQR